jgi:Holliday junction resolvase RusA-like endonuclease
VSITFLHSRADRDDTPMDGRIELIMDGKPAGKDRPRLNRNTGMIYTPKATKIAEDIIIAAWTAAGRPQLEGPIHFGLSVVVARPGGHFLKDGSLSAAGLRAPYPIRRPDLDNCLKLAADALNTRLMRDDSQIVEMTGLRYWSDDGWERTIIRAWPLS